MATCIIAKQVAAQERDIPHAIQELSSNARSSYVRQVERILTSTEEISEAGSRFVETGTKVAWNEWWNSMLGSEAFARTEATRWLESVGVSSSIGTGVTTGWDWSEHDKWLVDAIRDNMSWDAFVKKQMDVSKVNLSIATATLIRAQSQWPAIVPVDLGVQGSVPNLTPQVLQLFAEHDNSPIMFRAEQTKLRPLQDLERAMQSTRKSEHRSRMAIDKGGECEQWYRKLSTYPKPEERVQQAKIAFAPCSSVVGENRNNDLVEYHADAPISRSREFSVSIDMLFLNEHITTRLLSIEPVHDASTQPNGNGVLCDVRDGFVLVALQHISGQSEIIVRSKQRVPTQKVVTLTVTYDGTAEARAIRIYIDGEAMDSAVERDQLWKDFATGNGTWLKIGPTIRSDSDWCIEELTTYGLALTQAEVLSLRGDRAISAWEELDDSSRQMWRDHFARRVDLQWRYDRESYLHYLDNYSDKVESFRATPNWRVAPLFLGELDPNSFPLNCFEIDTETWKGIQVVEREQLSESLMDLHWKGLANWTANMHWKSLLSQIKRLEVPGLEKQIIPAKAGTTNIDADSLTAAKVLIDSHWNIREMIYHIVTSNAFSVTLNGME